MKLVPRLSSNLCDAPDGLIRREVGNPEMYGNPRFGREPGSHTALQQLKIECSPRVTMTNQWTLSPQTNKKQKPNRTHSTVLPVLYRYVRGTVPVFLARVRTYSSTSMQDCNTSQNYVSNVMYQNVRP